MLNLKRVELSTNHLSVLGTKTQWAAMQNYTTIESLNDMSNDCLHFHLVCILLSCRFTFSTVKGKILLFQSASTETKGTYYLA